MLHRAQFLCYKIHNYTQERYNNSINQEVIYNNVQQQLCLVYWSYLNRSRFIRIQSNQNRHVSSESRPSRMTPVRLPGKLMVRGEGQRDGEGSIEAEQ